MPFSESISPFLFGNKQPDRPHQMLGGDVDISFPKNLGDPMNAEAVSVSFQDLALAFSQRVNFGLLAVAAAGRAASNLQKIRGRRFVAKRVALRYSLRMAAAASAFGLESKL
jgi:hypothetical protein